MAFRETLTDAQKRAKKEQQVQEGPSGVASTGTPPVPTRASTRPAKAPPKAPAPVASRPSSAPVPSSLAAPIAIAATPPLASGLVDRLVAPSSSSPTAYVDDPFELAPCTKCYEIDPDCLELEGKARARLHGIVMCDSCYLVMVGEAQFKFDLQAEQVHENSESSPEYDDADHATHTLENRSYESAVPTKLQRKFAD